MHTLVPYNTDSSAQLPLVGCKVWLIDLGHF